MRERRELKSIDASTDFLSQLYDLAPFPLLQSAAMLSPRTQIDLLAGTGPALHTQWRAQRGAAAHAANLCGSYRGRTEYGHRFDDPHFAAVVDQLLGDRGARLNGPAAWSFPATELSLKSAPQAR